MSVINQMLHQECDELVTEEDSLNPEPPNHNTLQDTPDKPTEEIVVLSTARTSSTQCEVAKPAMVAKAWQHQSGTLAKFTGQDFPPKTVYGPPGTLDNVSAGAIAPLQQSLPNLVPLELVCRLF